MENTKNVKINKILFFISALLLVSTISLTCYIFTNPKNNLENNQVNNEHNSEQNNQQNNQNSEENNNIKPIKCDNCVDEILDLESNTIEKNILLNNKIRKLKKIRNSVYVDDVMLVEYESPGFTGIDEIYVINNEVIMIKTSASDIRSYEYLFYNGNLEEISVDMTLDSKYPQSMLEDYTESSLTVKDNKIIIIGSRITYNYAIEHEQDIYAKEICSYDEVTKKYSLVKDIYEEHKGEVISAIYEMKYLGNGQFSKFKRTEVLKRVDENHCNQ